MDYLFKKEYLNFKIDEISLYENETFLNVRQHPKENEFSSKTSNYY